MARRYRPQQFRDLVGQEPVAQALINAIESNRVAHAYLFTGARGVGKTSTARILAKALNCAEGPTSTPCDKCDSCQAIAAGDDIDVLEIDGASNRRIEEARDIRQNVGFRPSRSRYKIYIIDEVHMLTREAFNALLKTLEEPPAHVKFILATTEVQKIPITILSRCQRFDFAGIGIASIVERLSQIVADEGMEADKEALELVARRAGGSMRDAQSLLDQLLAFGGQRLGVEQVHQILGTAADDRVAALAQAVLDGNVGACLQLIGQIADQGLQLSEVFDQLLDYWRDLMVVQAAGSDDLALSVTGKHRRQLGEQAKQKSLDTILAGLDILVTAKNRLRATSHGRVVLELALLRLCKLDDLVPLNQLAQLVNSDSENIAQSQALRRSGQGPVAPGAKMESSQEKKNLNPELEGASERTALTITPENLPAVWQQLLVNMGLAASVEMRKASSLAIFGPNSLAIGFPSGYNLADKVLNSTKPALVEKALFDLTGLPWRIRFEVAKETNGSLTQATGAIVEAPGVRFRRQREEIRQHALVAKALDALGAQVMHMDDGFAVSGPDLATQPSDEIVLGDPSETNEEG